MQGGEEKHFSQITWLVDFFPLLISAVFVRGQGENSLKKDVTRFWGWVLRVKAVNFSLIMKKNGCWCL